MVFVSFSLRLCLLQGQVASVDIKLPRRSLQVEFSCNSCGVRTKRLINRLAYERGLVFVQVKSYVCLIVRETKHSHLVGLIGFKGICSSSRWQCGGCLKHHKLVDNLGLIVEYDFRKETSKDSTTYQI